jgi:hypothetical protein
MAAPAPAPEEYADPLNLSGTAVSADMAAGWAKAMTSCEILFGLFPVPRPRALASFGGLRTGNRVAGIVFLREWPQLVIPVPWDRFFHTWMPEMRFALWRRTLETRIYSPTRSQSRPTSPASTRLAAVGCLRPATLRGPP